MRILLFALSWLVLLPAFSQVENRWYVAGNLGYLWNRTRGFTPGFGLAGAAELQYVLGKGRWMLGIGQVAGRSYGQSFYEAYTTNLDPWAAHYYDWPETAYFVPNYRLTYFNTHLTIGAQIRGRKFYRGESNWMLRIALGVSVTFFQLRADALDAQGQPYDFSPLMEEVETRGSPETINLITEDRAEVRRWQRRNRDGRYESSYHPEQQGTGLGDYQTSLNVLAPFQLTFVRRLSPRWQVTLQAAMDGTYGGIYRSQSGALDRRLSSWSLANATQRGLDLYPTSGGITRFSLGATYQLGW